jgi:hypothetical protein
MRAESSSNRAGTQTGAVFLSYASQDAQAAQKICDALRAADIEVWFDKSEPARGRRVGSANPPANQGLRAVHPGHLDVHGGARGGLLQARMATR